MYGVLLNKCHSYTGMEVGVGDWLVTKEAETIELYKKTEEGTTKGRTEGRVMGRNGEERRYEKEGKRN